MDAPAPAQAGFRPYGRPSPVSDRERALEVAREFEAVFVSDAVKTMFQGVPTDPLSGDTSADSWRELLVDEYAKDLVRRGGFGLAEPIARELLKIQEAMSP